MIFYKYEYFHQQLYFQITLHISYVHAAVNPLLFLALHRALRRAALQLCCGCCVHWSQFVLALTAAGKLLNILNKICVIYCAMRFKIQFKYKYILDVGNYM